MFSWLPRIAGACWRPVQRYVHMRREDEEDASGAGDDPLLWSRDIGQHETGDYSFAVVQANQIIEDHSQVEFGRDATFVGVYDGHGGPDASRFISNHLLAHLMRFARESGEFSEEVIRNAFTATEDEFLAHVRRAQQIKPTIVEIGSCCLVGVIWRERLYVGNLGDSRAVLGYFKNSNKIVAQQLTRDHNASMKEVRQELRSSHPDDSQIVVQRQGVWRVKGIIQVSRSIGDAYLKRQEFAVHPSATSFSRPILTADPTVISHILRPEDRFLIFASDGLWEHLSNKKAVDMVLKFPRFGIARRLVRKALQEAARKSKMSYLDLKKMGTGRRRLVHDDISVIVIYLDHELSREPIAPVSVRGFVDAVGPSNFTGFGALG